MIFACEHTTTQFLSRRTRFGHSLDSAQFSRRNVLSPGVLRATWVTDANDLRESKFRWRDPSRTENEVNSVMADLDEDSLRSQALQVFHEIQSTQRLPSASNSDGSSDVVFDSRVKYGWRCPTVKNSSCRKTLVRSDRFRFNKVVLSVLHLRLSDNLIPLHRAFLEWFVRFQAKTNVTAEYLSRAWDWFTLVLEREIWEIVKTREKKGRGEWHRKNMQETHTLSDAPNEIQSFVA